MNTVSLVKITLSTIYYDKYDKDFRLTFDFQITTRRENLTLEDGSFGENILGEGRYLMEVKILGAVPLWFTKILTELEIYNTHFSKYGNEFMNYCLNNSNIDLKGREKVC